tara:strand:- start:316 stop:1365 length:1050 start_codon:yes stop_codon:yes gene_type:complete
VKRTILITGGAGFIGSHTSIELINNGFSIIVLDNFENSNLDSINRIKKVCLKQKNEINQNFKHIYGDIKDEKLLIRIFEESYSKNEKIDGVIHLAGVKSVSESISKPIKYWDQNLNGTICLLKIMDKFDCRNIVFSSSATIYGIRYENYLKESFLSSPIHPYGETKNAVEKMLNNIFTSGAHNWQIICLRYFNPIGGHTSGIIGESSKNKAENLFPIMCEVASKKRNQLIIYGNDWPTLDGTCIRDFVHVMDIAEAHVKAIDYLFRSKKVYHTINLGTGNPRSILELIKTFEKVNDIKINFAFSKRRNGDVPILCADPSLASKIINWKANRNIEQMCKDGWESYLNNLD